MGTHARRKWKDLAVNLLAVRRKLKLTQIQMAKLIGLNISPARVSEYEAGLREPDLMVLHRYAELAGVSIELLINDKVAAA